MTRVLAGAVPVRHPSSLAAESAAERPKLGRPSSTLGRETPGAVPAGRVAACQAVSDSRNPTSRRVSGSQHEGRAAAS